MADYAQMSDRELLEYNSVDSGRLAELISRYMKAVFAAAARYSGEADREELVSDGMQGLMAAIQSYDSEKGEFSAYAYACINNRLKNTVKRSLHRKSIMSDADSEELANIADTKPTPEQIIIDRENEALLLRNMRTNLTALELRCMEGVIMGLSYADIAEMMSLDKKAVDNAITRARAKLRKFYTDKL